MKKKIYAIIQARMSSSRLPGKVLKKIKQKPMLHYVIKQVKASKMVDEIIIVTTTEKEDKPIVDFCLKNKIKCFRGSKLDLLDRYYNCAKKYNCDPIVRVTSDCPIVDPEVIDLTISEFLKKKYDYISNNLENFILREREMTLAYAWVVGCGILM